MILALIMGAPLVPSKFKVAKRMVELLQLKSGQTLFDLGSGDGRVLIAASKKGQKSVGIEINPYMWMLSSIFIFMTGQQSRVKVYLGNYWNRDLSQAEGIIVYGLPQIMNRLSEKLRKELKPGTKIVSNSFQIPALKLQKQEVVDGTRIYLYRV